MKIQYASDLHLEFYERAKTWEPILIPIPDSILVLAGDIGNPSRSLFKQFLEYCSHNWKSVYYVAGNHEFYNKDPGPGTRKWFIPETIDARLESIEKICREFENVHFLNRNAAMLDEKTILLGATLWSSPTEDTAAAMNDTSRIWLTRDKKMHAADMCEMNEKDKSWLREHISAATILGYKIIVVTHYLPSPDVTIDKYMLPEYAPMISGFANFDMNDLFEYVSIWICGHTHGCKTVKVNKTTITTNTLGYPGEGVEGYSPDCCIEY